MKLGVMIGMCGAAALGSRLPSTEVHDRLDTRSLVLHGNLGSSAVLEGTPSGGIRVRLGAEGRHADRGATLEIDREGRSWVVALRDADESSIRLQVGEGDAAVEVESRPSGPRARLYAYGPEAVNGCGSAGASFHPGTPWMEVDHGAPTTIGIEGDHPVLHLRELLSDCCSDVWRDLLCVREGVEAGPWDASSD